MPAYTVAVRTLCEFSARRGDLDLRFTPAPSALEGIEGHQLVTSRRGAAYRAEVTLSGDYGDLHVRGRADGYDPEARRLDEIKTHRGPLDRLPDNHRALHWAQAEVYGWLMCQAEQIDDIELALVYLDIGSQRETIVSRRCSAAELKLAFERQCQGFLAWAEQEAKHRTLRDVELTALKFPEPAFRRGQRELAEAVYRASTQSRCLMAQAPTGIGKTIGTIYPALTALPRADIDRLYFLTAKTSGRSLALGALAQLRTGAPALRVIELVARDKACEHPDLACQGTSCPLAKGFYDRLPAARQAALDLPVWDRGAVRDLAASHTICPYYLGQELTRWSDVVVGDYNHYFDSSALLYALAQAHGWNVALLVDEAHNLVERARSMYSAEFEPSRLGALRKSLPTVLKRPASAVLRRWDDLVADWSGTYQRLDAAPEALIEALLRLQSAILDHLSDSTDAAGVSASHDPEIEGPNSLAKRTRPLADNAALQSVYFDALQFTRLAASFDTHSFYELTGNTDRPRLGLRNVLPAPFLAPRITQAHGLSLFSATLQPPDYYRALLGLPDNTVWLDVPTPFDAEQLQVSIATDISTRFPDRAASLAPIAELIGRRCSDHPGNYLAFFSSFDYLEQAAGALQVRWPDLTLWRQQRGMSEADQAAFLHRFVAGSQVLGLAVLGGAFAEGIDLPGERLHGAFIATLGLPQFNAEMEQMRTCLDKLMGAGTGYNYTYLYPGLQKVVQAAGRVIRTPTDRGVVVLLDDRYQRREVRALLPAWWKVQRISAPTRIEPVQPSSTAITEDTDG